MVVVPWYPQIQRWRICLAASLPQQLWTHQGHLGMRRNKFKKVLTALDKILLQRLKTKRGLGRAHKASAVLK